MNVRNYGLKSLYVSITERRHARGRKHCVDDVACVSPITWDALELPYPCCSDGNVYGYDCRHSKPRISTCTIRPLFQLALFDLESDQSNQNH